MEGLRYFLWEWKKGLSQKEYFICMVGLLTLFFFVERLLRLQVSPPELAGRVFLRNTLGIPLSGEPIDPNRYLTGYSLLWTLVLISLPFLWLAVHWTSRRLRSVGAPQWLTPITILPVANLVLFAVLCFIPSREMDSLESEPDRFQLDSAGFVIGSSSLLGLLATWFSAEYLGTYGFGLFQVVPIGIGAYSCIAFQANSKRPLGRCIGIALLSATCAAAFLMSFGIEGTICLLMATPLIWIETLVGVFLGRLILTAIRTPLPRTVTAFSIPALLFTTLFVEGRIAADYPMHVSTTEVVVNGTPDQVWPQVVSYDTLPTATEPLFIAGLAHPVKVTMSGEGIGADRVCHLSTGPMPEVITAWEKEKLLRFKVLSTPPSMKELSPWKIDPPHLHGFLSLLEGEITLQQLPGNKTRLVGKSWYKLRLEPEWYWRLWADAQIHAIHRRAFQAVRARRF